MTTSVLVTLRFDDVRESELRDLGSQNVLSSLASIPWPGLLSSGPKSVRELIWHVAASLPKPDIAAGDAWTRPRIQAEIRRIVGEQVGAWDYSLKARFVDDIGIS